ncbi:MAG: outer membrane beta-barrel domain-containing protein, partial [Myxococcaceae bacterium]
MRTLLIAALLLASTRPAFAVPTSGPLVAQSSSTRPGDADDDDEEDETPKPAPSDAPVSTPSTTRASTTPPVADTREQQLVSGAPLYNPNVAVHIVEKKRFSDSGKHELVLYPAWVQVNGKFTQHAGTAISYVYHLQENFGLQLTPLFNWVATESPFNRELVDKVRVEAQAATSLLLKWGVLAGVEATPLYGKFAFYENTMAHFSLVLNAGAGLGATLHQLTPETTDTTNGSPATF